MLPSSFSQSVLFFAGELAKNLLGPPGSKVVLGMMRNKTGVSVGVFARALVCVSTVPLETDSSDSLLQSASWLSLRDNGLNREHELLLSRLFQW